LVGIFHYQTREVSVERVGTEKRKARGGDRKTPKSTVKVSFPQRTKNEGRGKERRQ